MNANDIEMFQTVHAQAHVAPDDPEDTMLLQLTQRDAWVFLLMTWVTGMTMPCMEGELLSFHVRFQQCLFAQKPDWLKDEDELAAEGG